jgi:hypothetical protein
MLKMIRVRLLRLILGLVENLPKVKEWLSRKTILNVEKILERDIIAIILVQDGNHVIGLVVLGKLLINEIYYHRTSVEFFERTMV